MTAVEWLIEQLRQLSHSLEAHLGTGDIRVTQGMIDDFEEQAKQMEKEQVEISDDEIEKAAENYGWKIKTNTFSNPVKANELAESAKQDFIAACKWYREQLKLK